MSERPARKELRQPDAFQTVVTRAGGKLAPYARQLGLAALGLVALLAVIWGVQFQKQSDLLQLSAEYAAATSAYADALALLAEGSEVDWSSVENSLRALYERSAGSDLHPFVLFYLFHLFFESGRIEAAIDVAQELRGSVDGRPDLLAAAYYATAKAYEARGDLKTATAFYDQAVAVDANPIGEFLQAEAESTKRPPVPEAVRRRYLPEQAPAAASAPARKPISVLLK